MCSLKGHHRIKYRTVRAISLSERNTHQAHTVEKFILATVGGVLYALRVHQRRETI